jgi:predicted Fe-Mo cluster-binding NifX family protein
MKIAVTSTGPDIKSEMDPRFGRAAYFIIVDPDTMEYSVVENSQNMNLTQGAGIQAGKTIVDNGAEVLITGYCGPKAFMVLENAGIKTISGAKGRVEDIIRDFKEGKLKETQAPNVDGHWA